jgi:protein-tyrosine phosphatase
VRADNVRRLTPVGWQAALDHGVRRLVDLRFEEERLDDPSLPEGVAVVGISLFGRHDPELARAFDERVRNSADGAAVFASGYIHTLENSPERVATAVAAVADSNHAGGVVVHCFAGKDRTGIVAALLLGVAGVPDEIVAADYAESEQNMGPLFDDWIATADDEHEQELRRRLARADHGTMLIVLDWLRGSAGGAAAYLGQAGLTGEQIRRLRSRLVAT